MPRFFASTQKDTFSIDGRARTGAQPSARWFVHAGDHRAGSAWRRADAATGIAAEFAVRADHSSAALASRFAPARGAGPADRGAFATTGIAAVLLFPADRGAASLAIRRPWAEDIETRFANGLAQTAMFGAAILVFATQRVATSLPAGRAGIGGAGFSDGQAAAAPSIAAIVTGTAEETVARFEAAELAATRHVRRNAESATPATADRALLAADRGAGIAGDRDADAAAVCPTVFGIAVVTRLVDADEPLRTGNPGNTTAEAAGRLTALLPGSFPFGFPPRLAPLAAGVSRFLYGKYRKQRGGEHSGLAPVA